MAHRIWLGVALAIPLFIPPSLYSPAVACCPAPPSGKPVVNADQTVILIWDAATKTQHFIRQASFKSEADDFGFLVPTPNQPELDESGDLGFRLLSKLTKPETVTAQRPSRGMGCGCAGSDTGSAASGLTKEANIVKVLDEKLVAGFHATVLEADSANALIDWLKDHGYAFSPEVKAWAEPYVENGWKITALKIAKNKDTAEDKKVSASALRLSFKTDRPIFPYREPDSASQAKALGADHRLLRIYFLAEARYQGELTKDVDWTGKTVWANKLTDEDRQKLLGILNLPLGTGPKEWWLTEFEDNWPYRKAPADVYFSPSDDQDSLKRPPIIQYVAAPVPTDGSVYALAATMVFLPFFTRFRRCRIAASKPTSQS